MTAPERSEYTFELPPAIVAQAGAILAEIDVLIKRKVVEGVWVALSECASNALKLRTLTPLQARDLFWFLREAIAQDKIHTGRDGLVQLAAGTKLEVALESPPPPQGNP